MQMSDTRQINASPAEVYAALLDPDMLIKCVPGATEVTGSPEEGFEATVVQKVGPVKATFKGQVASSTASRKKWPTSSLATYNKP